MNYKSGALFSNCRKYRYSLFRIWDEDKPMVMFIGLNPSTANENTDDPTIKSVCRIAANNGFGGVYMMNCFPIVSPDPSVLKEFWESPNPYVQHQDTLNRSYLTGTAKVCSAVVFAWGSFKIVSEVNRDKELLKMFPDALALSVNKNGSPKHPLYCKSDTKFIPFSPHF